MTKQDAFDLGMSNVKAGIDYITIFEGIATHHGEHIALAYLQGAEWARS